MVNSVFGGNQLDPVAGLQTSVVIFTVIVALLLLALFVCVYLTSKYKLYGFDDTRKFVRKKRNAQKSVYISAEFQ